MSEVAKSDIRIGNFTSSEIHRLLSMGTREMTEEELKAYQKDNPKSKKKTIECWPGKGALTYIDECNMERESGLPLEREVSKFDLHWGQLCEKYVFQLLGIDYEECSQQTRSHPTIEQWKGTPDGLTYEEVVTIVADSKCPSTRKSFIQLVRAMNFQPQGDDPYGKKVWEAIIENHKDGEKFYWQLVSNSVITGAKYAELIAFMPYKSELNVIREIANNWDGPDQWKYKRIYESFDDDLPYILDGGKFKNINKFRFEVCPEDKELLAKRVVEAEPLLVPFENIK